MPSQCNSQCNNTFNKPSQDVYFTSICVHLLPNPIFRDRNGKRLLFCASVHYIDLYILMCNGRQISIDIKDRDP